MPRLLRDAARASPKVLKGEPKDARAPPWVGPSSFRAVHNSHIAGKSGAPGKVCGRVKAGRRPREGLGLDAAADRQTVKRSLAKGLSANAFLASNLTAEGDSPPSRWRKGGG